MHAWLRYSLPCGRTAFHRSNISPSKTALLRILVLFPSWNMWFSSFQGLLYHPQITVTLPMTCNLPPPRTRCRWSGGDSQSAASMPTLWPNFCWMLGMWTLHHDQLQGSGREPIYQKGVGGKGCWKSAVFWFIGEGKDFPMVSLGSDFLCCFFLLDCQPTDLIYLPIYIYTVFIFIKKNVYQQYMYIYIHI